MRTITRLVMQKRNRERVNVYLDGEYAFALPLMEAVRLKVGQTLTEADIAALRDEDAFQRAYGRALELLGRRPRSRRELERFLTKKEVAPQHIARIVERLEALEFINDLAFARYWIENRDTFRPRGARAIRYELRRKGVNETIIREALAEAEMDEVEGAYRVARKQLPRLRAIEDRRTFQQKLAGHLGRRGYGWDVIRTVSERLWQERHQDD